MPRTAMLALVLVASPLLAGTRLDTADQEALKAFRLTSENVRKSAAVTHRLAVEAAKDPALVQFMEKRSAPAATLEAKAKALESEPRIASALRAESMSAREYVMVQVAAFQVGLLKALKARGVNLDAAQLSAVVNPANVEFVNTHSKDMEDLGRSDEELLKVSTPANALERDAPPQGKKN
jgi:hypothetical protein